MTPTAHLEVETYETVMKIANVSSNILDRR